MGSSINLPWVNRVSSYFMPSILAKADRRVIRYFNKHGRLRQKNVKLTLLILSTSATWDQVIDLEQGLRLNLMYPNLNVDLVAGGYYGYHTHTPMSTGARNILRKLRGCRTAGVPVLFIFTIL